jgi:hypothetical protein
VAWNLSIPADVKISSLVESLLVRPKLTSVLREEAVRERIPQSVYAFDFFRIGLGTSLVARTNRSFGSINSSSSMVVIKDGESLRPPEVAFLR